MKYLIDSNCFIEPHRGVCPIDVAISFWTKMKELTMERDVYVLDKVKGELTEWEDELKRWIVENIGGQVLNFTAEGSQDKFREVNLWALMHPKYTQAAKDKFMDNTRADIYLVSYAAVSPNEWTVVTQEVSAPLKTTEIKLPDACSHFKVRCIRLMDLFRELQETF